MVDQRESEAQMPRVKAKEQLEEPIDQWPPCCELHKYRLKKGTEYPGHPAE